jgi:hypothetical protein
MNNNGDASESVYVGASRGVETWLRVYADGRIVQHTETDGARFLRHGADEVDEIVDLEYVRQRWPEHAPMVEEVQIRLGIARLVPEPEPEPSNNPPMDEALRNAFTVMAAAEKDVNMYASINKVTNHAELVATFITATTTLLTVERICNSLDGLAAAIHQENDTLAPPF